jgi:hypothetical protein
VADLLKKILLISASDYEGDLSITVKDMQKEAVRGIIEKLAPEAGEEANLNANLILSDIIEFKDSFGVMNEKPYL